MATKMKISKTNYGHEVNGVAICACVVHVHVHLSWPCMCCMCICAYVHMCICVHAASACARVGTPLILICQQEPIHKCVFGSVIACKMTDIKRVLQSESPSDESASQKITQAAQDITMCTVGIPRPFLSQEANIVFNATAPTPDPSAFPKKK